MAGFSMFAVMFGGRMGLYTDTLITLSGLGKSKKVSRLYSGRLTFIIKTAIAKICVELTGRKFTYDISTTLGDLLECG